MGWARILLGSGYAGQSRVRVPVQGGSMMKRLAAAVVAAFVNLLGAASPNANADAMTALVASADDDGPDTPDSVEYRRAEGTGAGRPVVLAMASAVCGEPIDGAWLVRHADGPVLAVAAQL